MTGLGIRNLNDTSPLYQRTIGYKPQPSKHLALRQVFLGANGDFSVVFQSNQKYQLW